MFAILKSIVKRVLYVGLVVSSIGLVLDVKEIVNSATPVGVAKIIAGRVMAEYTFPESLIAGKCIMLIKKKIQELLKVNRNLKT